MKTIGGVGFHTMNPSWSVQVFLPLEYGVYNKHVQLTLALILASILTCRWASVVFCDFYNL